MAFFEEGEVDFAEQVFSFFCLGWAERLFKTLNFQEETSFENVFSTKRLFFFFYHKKVAALRRAICALGFPGCKAKHFDQGCPK